MKHLLLFLLLLNLLYALWQLQGRPLAAVAAPALSERAVAAPQAQKAGAGAQRQGDALLCVTLGRFSARVEAEQLRQRLLALDVDSKVLEREVVIGAEYWLVQTVEGSERQAVAQLSILQERGIESFLITRGELAGSLSLGVFASEENARARQEQLRGLGQDVRLHALSKQEPVYMVEIASEARRLVDQELLSRLRQSFAGLQHRYEVCAGVANSARIP